MKWNTLSQSARNAILIGALCSASYLAVYVARNVLSAVTPQMIDPVTGVTDKEQIGLLSSVYFTMYAVGQLINGAIGDKIKAHFMISTGLFMAGVANVLFVYLPQNAIPSVVAYGLSGFFLSMIYGPMTKVVAENTEPHHATRCSLGYTFSSFFGSPLAGVAAAALVWQSVFWVAGGALVGMAAVCLVLFLVMERRGIVKYGQYKPQKQGRAGAVGVLIRHRIVKFSLISILTGVVRTTVVFWLPTYINEYLGFDPGTSAALFTAATFVISLTTFIAVFVYERLGRNMDLTILLMFSLSTVFFIAVFFVSHPAVNIVLLVLAIMASNSSATMLWSRYCPSLRDTGMVSGATGFLDFLSYMAASVSSTVFAGAVDGIGWSGLVLVWGGLVALGILVALPWGKILRRPNSAW